MDFFFIRFWGGKKTRVIFPCVVIVNYSLSQTDKQNKKFCPVELEAKKLYVPSKPRLIWNSAKYCQLWEPGYGSDVKNMILGTSSKPLSLCVSQMRVSLNYSSQD